MDSLLALRLSTLVGWLLLTCVLWYAVVVKGQGMARATRDAWFVLVSMHIIVAAGAALIEGVWALKAALPGSPLLRLGQKLYNPIYLLNASVEAAVPCLLVALLVDQRGRRRIAVFVAGAVISLSWAMIARGALDDWSALMVSTQVLSFVGIAGYLTFWGGVLLGYLMRTDEYLLGIMAVLALFHVLLPIQTAFFEFVGHGAILRIWPVHQVLQLLLVLAELAISVAFARQRARATSGNSPALVGRIG